MHVPQVMNLRVEPRTLVLIAQYSTTKPRWFPIFNFINIFRCGVAQLVRAFTQHQFSGFDSQIRYMYCIRDLIRHV